MRIDRLKILIDARFSGNQTAFARRIGKSASQVNQWFGGVRNIGNGTARDIELSCALPQGWMDDESAVPPLVDNENTAQSPRQFIYPLISNVQAGAWAEIADNFAPGEALEWVSSPRKAGKHAFWLTVTGDSMEPRFPAGGSILVDPDVGAGPGDCVVAKLTDTQEATFKKLSYDSGKWYLVPINSQYQAQLIDRNDVRIIGRVVFYQPLGFQP